MVHLIVPEKVMGLVPEVRCRTSEWWRYAAAVVDVVRLLLKYLLQAIAATDLLELVI